MRIAHIINHLGETGLNNVALDLINTFIEHEHECKVFYLKDSLQPMLFPCETELLRNHNTSIFRDFDIIHVHGLGPSLYIFKHKPWCCHAKVVNTFHNYVFQDYTSTYGNIKGNCYAFALLTTSIRMDKIVALSNDAKHYYERWIPKKKLTFVYNTRITDRSLVLTKEEKQELLHFKGDGVLIGMNGILVKRKGIDIILKALRQLPDYFKLYLVGNGEKRKTYEDLAENYGLKERVFFSGNHPKAYRYLPFYDIFALCSRSEGFPLSLLEASSFGKNIVCSDLAILQECFSEEEVTFFHSEDETSLAEAIIKAKEKNKGAMALKKFNKSYSPTVFYNNYLNIYNSLANKK